MFKKAFDFILELTKVVIVSLVIIVPIRYFVIQPFYVKGASMEPNFYDHEYLVVDEISYRFNAPSRGDIVVFRYPRDPQEFFIKRIIGLPGEKIQIKEGKVFIYSNERPEGYELIEDYLDKNTKTYSLDSEVIELSSNEYFVLGDNRDSSKDSRSFGAVNRSFLIGKVALRGWPLDRARIF